MWGAPTEGDRVCNIGVDAVVTGVCGVVVTGVPDAGGWVTVWFCISGVWKSSDRLALVLSPLGLSLAICCVKVSVN